MKIIHKYILKEMRVSILFGISLFTFVFLIEFLVNLMETVLVSRASPLLVLQLVSQYIPPVLPYTIPMGVFLGIMITFSKFTKTSEGIAMTFMGMSLKDILKMPFRLAVAIAIFIVFLQEVILPKSFTRIQYITSKIIASAPPIELREKVFLQQSGSFSVYIDEKSELTNVAKKVIIFTREEDSPFPSVVRASRAQVKDGNMNIEDADFFKVSQDGLKEVSGKYKSQEVPLASMLSGGVKIDVDEIETMSVIQLLKKIKEVKKEEERRPYEVELHKKLTTPLTAIFLAIIGVVFSLGHHRSGKGANFGFSIMIIFFYITLTNIVTVMANKEGSPIALLMWVPVILLSLLTSYLYMKKRSD